MKAHHLIAESLSTWRTFQDAADLAHSAFDALDDEERERLALRAFTEEFRAALRRKDENGLPLYANIERFDEARGKTVQVYKQTALFTEDDYDLAIGACQTRIAAERRSIKAFRKAKAAKFTQLEIESA